MWSRLLLEQFLQRAPGPAHRAALEACALVRVTTESLLAELLAVPDAHDLFEWLRGLSFIETRPGGLFPTTSPARCWSPTCAGATRTGTPNCTAAPAPTFTRRLPETQGPEQQLTLFDFVYLHRDNPAVRPFFEWQTSGRTAPDRLRSDDSTRWRRWWRTTKAQRRRNWRAWLARQPENVVVFRDGAGQGSRLYDAAGARTHDRRTGPQTRRPRLPGTSWRAQRPCAPAKAPPISASGWPPTRIRQSRPRRA
jgi:hypothetical protein